MIQKLNQKNYSIIARSMVLVGIFALCSNAGKLIAQDSNAPVAIKPTIVTGSLIPTAETVGPAPVETVSSVDIQKTGSQDILSTLKSLSPSFTGNGNVGQSLNNGGYGEAYIALRNLPTLVLLDGRRLNISPFSTFVGTLAPDVNLIPVAMIDRIEVLKDGASTIYGSDAIGGVVNIITKKEFNGVELDAHYGFGMDKGRYNEDRFAAVVGYATNGTRIVAGAQYYYADPIKTRDRSIGGLSGAQLNAAGINAPSYFSPSYPGRVDSFLLAGSPLAKGAPGYNPAITAPPVVSGGPFATVADYNAAAQSQLGFTPYLPISSIPASAELGASLLNTTLLGTITVQRQDRRSAFANFEQDVFGKSLTAYGQVLWGETESLGALAPAPIPFLGPYNLTFPSNNPANVFGNTLGAGGLASPRVRSRLIETGNRFFDTKNHFWHFVGGLKGDVLDTRVHYDVNAAYSQTTSENLQNSASAVLLNQAMAPDGAGLSTLTDSKGNHVPLYNILALPGVNDPHTVSAITASAGQGGFSDLLEAHGVGSMDVFKLPAGPFQLALGAQFINENLDTTADSLLASGNLIGLNAIPPFGGGTRDRIAGFAQGHIMVTSPDWNVPGFYDFEVDAQGRYETLESHGTRGVTGSNSADDLVPKVGFRWQPIDEEFTIRGTYSQGFVVPALVQLFGPPLQSNPYIVTPTSASDLTPVALQQTVNYLANRDVPPGEAETMTLGLVMTPKFLKGLTISADYYHIEQTSYNFLPSGSGIIADLNARGAGSRFVNHPALHGTPIYLDQDNNPYVPTAGDPSTAINADNFGTLNIPLLPGGSIRTEGIDLRADYHWPLDNWGTFDFFANANVLFTYDVKLGKGTPYNSYAGQYTDSQAVAAPQGMIPDYNITLGLSYSIWDFDYTITAHYLPGVTDFGDMHPSVGAPSNDFTVNGKPFQVDDYYRIDMQLAYTFRNSHPGAWWNNTRLAIGCNNVTDSKPNLIASSSEDNTDKGSYDIIGRFLYFEVSTKFW
jgi:iron complex outermembrane receptor protein